MRVGCLCRCCSKSRMAVWSAFGEEAKSVIEKRCATGVPRHCGGHQYVLGKSCNIFSTSDHHLTFCDHDRSLAEAHITIASWYQNRSTR